MIHKTGKLKARYCIGIDSGTNTGLAVWDRAFKRITDAQTMPIHKAMELVLSYSKVQTEDGRELIVVVEDARQVRFKTSPEKAQGAGYVKAHAQIWEAFLKDKGISFEMRRPNKALTKWDADYFKRHSGYEGRTTSHSRDAAMLVYQM